MSLKKEENRCTLKTKELLGRHFYSWFLKSPSDEKRRKCTITKNNHWEWGFEMANEIKIKLKIAMSSRVKNRIVYLLAGLFWYYLFEWIHWPLWQNVNRPSPLYNKVKYDIYHSTLQYSTVPFPTLFYHLYIKEQDSHPQLFFFPIDRKSHYSSRKGFLLQRSQFIFWMRATRSLIFF